jgi:hypothetical protein
VLSFLIIGMNIKFVLGLFKPQGEPSGG